MVRQTVPVPPRKCNSESHSPTHYSAEATFSWVKAPAVDALESMIVNNCAAAFAMTSAMESKTLCIGCRAAVQVCNLKSSSGLF